MRWVLEVSTVPREASMLALAGRAVRSAGWVGLVALLALALVSCGGGAPARGPRVARGARAFRPGQFWYTRTISTRRARMLAGGMTIDRRGYTHRHGPNILFDLGVSDETWVGVDGTMRDRMIVVVVRFASGAGRTRWDAYGRRVPNFNHLWLGWRAHDVIALGGDKFPAALPYYPSEWTGPGGRDLGDGLFTYRELLSLPSGPAALRARLRRAETALARRRGTADGYAVSIKTDASGELSDIAALLSSPLPASDRLALFHAAVTMPGARVNPRAQDSLGRRGVAVSASAGLAFERLIFDRASGSLLEAGNGPVVAQGVVDSAYALPKGVSPIHPAGAPPEPQTLAMSPRVGTPTTVFRVMLPYRAGRRSRQPPALDWVLLGSAGGRCFFDGFAEVLRPLRASASILRAGRLTYVYRLGPPPAHGHTWCAGRYALSVAPDYARRPRAPNPNSALPNWFSEGARGSSITFQVR